MIKFTRRESLWSSSFTLVGHDNYWVSYSPEKDILFFELFPKISPDLYCWEELKKNVSECSEFCESLQFNSLPVAAIECTLPLNSLNRYPVKEISFAIVHLETYRLFDVECTRYRYTSEFCLYSLNSMNAVKVILEKLKCFFLKISLIFGSNMFESNNQQI